MTQKHKLYAFALTHDDHPSSDATAENVTKKPDVTKARRGSSTMEQLPTLSTEFSVPNGPFKGPGQRWGNCRNIGRPVIANYDGREFISELEIRTRGKDPNKLTLWVDADKATLVSTERFKTPDPNLRSFEYKLPLEKGKVQEEQAVFTKFGKNYQCKVKITMLGEEVCDCKEVEDPVSVKRSDAKGQ